ncbi:putative nuclease HARBI1 isoform X1 [Chenopodium quinoa]|uniref:putative nuclease HARBI1 isoform X1 n=1 Tax=Chenopodium quinoa TaxID=63459 RepID=UPI000B7861EC|nr:putative nuclease HARBI1 isoform X1 [Chenopodium quinoa]
MQSGPPRPPAPPFRPPKRTQPSNNKEKAIDLSGSPHPNHPNTSRTRSSANEVSSNGSAYDDVIDESSSEEEDDEDLLLQEQLRGKQMMLYAATGVTILTKYYLKYLIKQPTRISLCSGWHWLQEVLSTSGESYRILRMEPHVFYSLAKLLMDKYGLKSTRTMSAEEALGIFVYLCAQFQSNRNMKNRFKHSGETISRKFNEVLEAMIRFSKDIVRPSDPNFKEVPTKIRNNYKYWPHFKDCIGAIDGTHIPCVVSEEDEIPYIGRKGNPTQNVLAICDFDMLFTYFVAGWPGSVHDNRILKDAMEDRKKYFPHPPEGKYYVVDAGYPNMKGFMAPFKGERYHVPDFRRSTQPPNGFYEVFNYSHSSLRNVIERTFGVWKKRWRILSIMPSFSLETQKKLVAATMAMHNYIRRHALEDLEFDKCDADPYYIPEVEGDEDIGGNPVTTLEEHDGSMDDFSLESIRYNIATSLMSRGL